MSHSNTTPSANERPVGWYVPVALLGMAPIGLAMFTCEEGYAGFNFFWLLVSAACGAGAGCSAS